MVILCDCCKGVKSKDQTLTCGVLKGGPCTPCKKRATIRQKINRLEAEITKLKTKHDGLVATMNAVHDPFIHKLPPEIGSHIFRPSLPSIDIGGPGLWWAVEGKWVASRLKLGAVCRKWCQLAWATPDLWETLYIGIRRSTDLCLAESLPDLLSEWLGRSGALQLTIFFRHSGYSAGSAMANDTLSEDAFSDESTSDDLGIHPLGFATRLAIKILNLHLGRWRNLHLDTHRSTLFWFHPTQETC